jgi:hypothetical protein
LIAEDICIGGLMYLPGVKAEQRGSLNSVLLG